MIFSILSVLSGKTNFQLQYQLIFSLWCLTFNPHIAEKFPHSGAIQILGDILTESTKEKVKLYFWYFSNTVYRSS